MSVTAVRCMRGPDELHRNSTIIYVHHRTGSNVFQPGTKPRWPIAAFDTGLTLHRLDPCRTLLPSWSQLRRESALMDRPLSSRSSQYNTHMELTDLADPVSLLAAARDPNAHVSWNTLNTFRYTMSRSAWYQTASVVGVRYLPYWDSPFVLTCKRIDGFVFYLSLCLERDFRSILGLPRKFARMPSPSYPAATLTLSTPDHGLSRPMSHTVIPDVSLCTALDILDDIRFERGVIQYDEYAEAQRQYAVMGRVYDALTGGLPRPHEIAGGLRWKWRERGIAGDGSGSTVNLVTDFGIGFAKNVSAQDILAITLGTCSSARNGRHIPDDGRLAQVRKHLPEAFGAPLELLKCRSRGPNCVTAPGIDKSVFLSAGAAECGCRMRITLAAPDCFDADSATGEFQRIDYWISIEVGPLSRAYSRRPVLPETVKGDEGSGMLERVRVPNVVQSEPHSHRAIRRADGIRCVTALQAYTMFTHLRAKAGGRSYHSDGLLEETYYLVTVPLLRHFLLGRAA